MVSRTRTVKDILWGLALFGLMAAIFRLWFGLGGTTNLSDAVPWGLWKILNMVAGVAISTSGFMVGFLVYVLKMERFRPLVKPAILVAFLGYGCSCMALLFDIGLPHRFWHPIFMWNEHSFLFEVFWCVLLYFTVTAIELSPTLLERLRSERIVRFLHRISIGIVIVGISLSSLHHSSLGSLFLVTPLRLHPLWYSPMLPLFFILSAMGAGLMFIVLVKIIYARWYDRESVFGPQPLVNELICVLPNISGRDNGRRPGGPEMPMLLSLTRIVVGILAVYLALKLYDLIAGDAWVELLAGTWESWLFGFELIIAVVLPAVLVLYKKSRSSPTGLGIAAFAASAGLALNRLDVGIFGYFHDAKEVYFPSLAEWALGIGVVAAAGLVFLFIAENFAVFSGSWRESGSLFGTFRATFDRFSHVWNTVLTSGLQRVTIIAVFVLPLAWVTMYPPYSGAQQTAVHPASGLDVMRASLRIDGNRSGVFVDFPHADHQKRLGGEASCKKCHHICMPGDRSTPCSRCHRDMINSTSLFDHALHEKEIADSMCFIGLYPANFTCKICHASTGAKSSENTKSCLECHKQDMAVDSDVVETVDLSNSIGYYRAMHENCVECHKSSSEKVDRPNLGECFTCHEMLIPLDVANQSADNTDDVKEYGFLHLKQASIPSNALLFR